MDVWVLLLKFTESVTCDKNEDNSKKLKNQDDNSHEYYLKKTIATILPSPLVLPGFDRLLLAKIVYASHIIPMSFSSISFLLVLSYSEAGLPPTSNAHRSQWKVSFFSF